MIVIIVILIFACIVATMVLATDKARTRSKLASHKKQGQDPMAHDTKTRLESHTILDIIFKPRIK
jgi:hypothetical protein